MRVIVSIRWMSLLFVLLATGCGQSGYQLTPQNAGIQPQQDVVAQRNQELQTRARALDQDNQELESLLAQSRQQQQLFKDELHAVRDQLRSANQQMTDLRTEKRGLESKTEALVASVRRRSAAKIKPNNSLLRDLASAHLPGVEVRQDGDVVRVELPADTLFHPGSAQLQPEGRRLVESVAPDLLRNYPDQIIGVEAHTDSNSIRSREFPDSHRLSTARASAVFELLVGTLQVPPQQLFVTGHGANHPVVSNATTAGRARNQRVELVVYPETFRGR